MSKIPENIKIAINDYASGRADKPNVIKHAEFGYSLSLERIGELEKDLNHLKAALMKVKDGCVYGRPSIDNFLENVLSELSKPTV